MDIQPYTHKVQYYETDKMGIVHHANYIRWFEEARIDLMEQIGYTYARMEREGVGSPVVGVEAAYKRPVEFGGSVVIEAVIESFTGTRMTVAYEVKDPAGTTLHATGRTHHCFAGANGRPISLKKANPEAYLLFAEVMEAQAQSAQ